MLLKKKKIIVSNSWEEFVSSIKTIEKESKEAVKNLKINFNAFERKKVSKFRENNRLIPFMWFLELFENILLNNKMKPWFSVTKGLNALDDWRFPIYKKLAIISNIKQKEDLLSKDASYDKYSILFEEKNISKESFILWRIKELFKKDVEYWAVTYSPLKSIVWNLMFWVWLICFNLLVVYWWLLQTWTIWYPVFSDPTKWGSALDVFVINLLYWTYYIENTFIQILAVLKTSYFFLFLTLILYLSLLTFFTYQSTYRKRTIDKLYNESAFLELLRIRIKQLELEGWIWKWKNTGRKFLYKNFLDLIKSTILYWLEKKYINQDFTNDILQVLTLYLVYRRFPEKTNLTEWFQNLLKMILDSYYSMLSWTNTNFNLWVVDDWIVSYKNEIENVQWEKQFNKTRTTFWFIWNIITSLTIIVMLFLSLKQWQTIEKLIKLTMN